MNFTDNKPNTNWYRWDINGNLDTYYETQEKYKDNRLKALQARQAKNNQPLLNNWSR